MIDKVFPHDLNAKLDYVFDWEPWLDDQGDTISTYTITAQTGLTVTTSSNTSLTVTVWVTIDSTVRKGQLLTLACKITTAAGRIDERTITLRATQL